MTWHPFVAADIAALFWLHSGGKPSLSLDWPNRDGEETAEHTPLVWMHTWKRHRLRHKQPETVYLKHYSGREMSDDIIQYKIWELHWHSFCSPAIVIYASAVSHLAASASKTWLNKTHCCYIVPKLLKTREARHLCSVNKSAWLPRIIKPADVWIITLSASVPGRCRLETKEDWCKILM